MNIICSAAIRLEQTQIWEILRTEVDVPKMYGWFHILWLVIIFSATALLCLRFGKCNERVFKKIIFICWVIIAVLEIFRQVLFNFETGGDRWEYVWAQFPFQLCSTPLYVLPLVAFLKDGKIRDGMIAYTMSYAFFGGFAVLCYPGSVFISHLAVNVQTMISHGMQFVTGIFCAVYVFDKADKKYFVRAVPVFLCGVGIAVLMNHIPIDVIQAYGAGGYMDMFFLSPHVECEIPVLNLVQANAPYAVFVATYVIGATGFSALMYYSQRAIIGALQRRKVLSI